MIKLNTTMKDRDGALWLVISEDRTPILVGNKLRRVGALRGYVCRPLRKDGTVSHMEVIVSELFPL